MKQKLLHISWSIYQDIIYTGVDEGVSRDQEKKVIRFNQFVLLALLVNCVSVGIYLYHKLYISGLINVTSAYLFLLAYYFNYRRKLEIGRILSIININLYLIIISHVEGLKAGGYLLYFPYFLAITFVVSIRRNFRELLLVCFITLVSLLACILGNPDTNNIQIIHPGMYATLYNSNLFVSLCATIFFSYAILRLNKENEVNILQEKKFGDTIFNTSLDGVFIIFSETNTVANCNRRALELFDVQHIHEIEGTPIAKWFNEEQLKRMHDLEEGPGENTRNWQGELVLQTQNGKNIYAFVSMVPFVYKSVRYIKVSVLDISDIRITEFELMKAKQKAEEAVTIKSRFLSNMSHELRTPLNGIIGASNLLLNENYLEGQKPQLDILKYSSEHMMMLINDILDYNKIEAGKLKLEEAPVNIKELCDRLAAQFAPQIKARGLHFYAEIDNVLDTEVYTDQTRLNQVLSNLLSNAMKFTKEGSVCLIAKRLFASSSKVTIQFMVVDTGIGIPKEKQKEIFASFTQADVDTTRKYGGTGLGLSISKELVSMFSSELQVESSVGKGSVFQFTVEWKINTSRKMYINEDNTRDLRQLDGTRILLAEDNPVNMAIARRFLKKWGIELTEAVNGQLAVDAFKQGEFDLVLLDLEMPEMDGATALKEIRKLNPEVPVLAFTAAAYDNMLVDLLQKGFVDFIPKPFRPEDLHGKIFFHLNNERRA
jgi:signal transduction histidine kinase/ActR/RegA family two-component response regulator